jgi:site-specific DNA-methyltransferase (adenine-specific)
MHHGKFSNNRTPLLDAHGNPAADQVLHADNLEALAEFVDESFQLIYIDPPFNTGRKQSRTRTKTVRDEQNGDRVGFGGNVYRTEILGEASYEDAFDDFLVFIEPRLREAHRLLRPAGTFYFHIDYREAHYCKVLLDRIFGRENFLNEIIWAYDYGAKSKKRWPAKHDTILVYVKDIAQYYFNSEEVDREPYMAPGLVTPEKAARGKLPSSVWWHTIVSPTGKEKTGYPTQKPEGVLRRIITASSQPGDWVLDFFAGSGTTGAVAKKLGRRYVLIDQNEQAVNVINDRLAGIE